jgi:uncharacterized protein (DUF58 family)
MHAAAPIQAEDRVQVSLKSLIDLAAAAKLLRFQNTRVRAAHAGQYVSRFKGRGMSFAESRLYQPGDDVRLMDWRVTARTDKPHSKVFQEEREQPMFIAVDFGPTMAFATRGVFKQVQAARIAALLAWAARWRGDRVGGQVFGAGGCLELKPQNGQAALLRFLDSLAQPRYLSREATDLQQALLRLRRHAKPGSRVYIISDFRGLNAVAEQHLSLLSRHCEVALIQVYDPLEQQLPQRGRFRLTDTLRDIVLDSTDRQRLLAYHQQFQARQTHLQNVCQKLSLLRLSCGTHQSAINQLSSVSAAPLR